MLYQVSTLQITNLNQILWYRILSLFFKIYKPTILIFDPPLLRLHPFHLQTFWHNPF